MSKVNFQEAVIQRDAITQNAISSAFERLINKPELTQEAIVKKDKLRVTLNGDDGSGIVSRINAMFFPSDIPVLDVATIEANDTFQIYKKLLANQGYDVSITGTSQTNDYSRLEAKALRFGTAATLTGAAGMAFSSGAPLALSMAATAVGVTSLLVASNRSDSNCVLEFNPINQNTAAGPKLAI